MLENSENKRGVWWWTRRPTGSLGHLLTYYCFPTGALGTIDGGEQANWFPCRYSVLNTKLTKKSSDAVMITRVSRQFQKQVFLQPLEWQLGDQKLMHTFLCMLDSPIPMLAQDLLCKLLAQITSWEAAVMCRGPTGTCSSTLGIPGLSRRSWRWTLPTWDLWEG